MSDLSIVQQAVGQFPWRLVALYICLVKYKNTVIPAWMPESSAKDGNFKLNRYLSVSQCFHIHVIWIPAIPAGMTAKTHWSIKLHTEQRIDKV